MSSLQNFENSSNSPTQSTYTLPEGWETMTDIPSGKQLRRFSSPRSSVLQPNIARQSPSPMRRAEASKPTLLTPPGVIPDITVDIELENRDPLQLQQSNSQLTQQTSPSVSRNNSAKRAALSKDRSPKRLKSTKSTQTVLQTPTIDDALVQNNAIPSGRQLRRGSSPRPLAATLPRTKAKVINVQSPDSQVATPTLSEQNNVEEQQQQSLTEKQNEQEKLNQEQQNQEQQHQKQPDSEYQEKIQQNQEQLEQKQLKQEKLEQEQLKPQKQIYSLNEEDSIDRQISLYQMSGQIPSGRQLRRSASPSPLLVQTLPRSAATSRLSRIRPSIVSPRVKTPAAVAMYQGDIIAADSVVNKEYQPEQQIEQEQKQKKQQEQNQQQKQEQNQQKQQVHNELRPSSPQYSNNSSRSQLQAATAELRAAPHPNIVELIAAPSAALSPSIRQMLDAADDTVYIPPSFHIQPSPISRRASRSPAPSYSSTMLTSTHKSDRDQSSSSTILPLPQIDQARLRNQIPTGRQLRRTPIQTRPSVPPRTKDTAAVEYANLGADNNSNSQRPQHEQEQEQEQQEQQQQEANINSKKRALENDILDSKTKINTAANRDSIVPSEPADDEWLDINSFPSPQASTLPISSTPQLQPQPKTPKSAKRIREITNVVNDGPRVPSPYRLLMSEAEAEFLANLKARRDVTKLTQQASQLEEKVSKVNHKLDSIRHQLELVDEELRKYPPQDLTNLIGQLNMAPTSTPEQISARLNEIVSSTKQNLFKIAELEKQKDLSEVERSLSIDQLQRSTEREIVSLRQPLQSIQSQKLLQKQQSQQAAESIESQMQQLLREREALQKSNNDLLQKQLIQEPSTTTQNIPLTRRERVIAQRTSYYVLRWNCLNAMSVH